MVNAVAGPSSHSGRVQQPFLCTTSDVRHLASILRAVYLTGHSRARFVLMDMGFQVVVDAIRTVQATAFIPSHVFQTYKFVYQGSPIDDDATEDGSEDLPQEESMSFEISLGHLLECLNIFGNAGHTSGHSSDGEGGRRFSRGRRFGAGGEEVDNLEEQENGRGPRGWRKEDESASGGIGRVTTARISWDGPGEPLVVLLGETADGPTTTCRLATSEEEGRATDPFNNDNEVLKLIISSSHLSSAFGSLDSSCSVITFLSLEPNAGYAAKSINPSNNNPAKKSRAEKKGVDFRIMAEGNWGSVEMDLPNSGKVLDMFTREASVKASYRYAQLSRAFRAIASSVKVSLRIEANGRLSLQCLMPFLTNSSSKTGETSDDGIVEFLIEPLIDDNEDED